MTRMTALAVLASTLWAAQPGEGRAETLAFEVACDLTTFLGTTAPGTPYIVHGYIYPEGTITGADSLPGGGALLGGGAEAPELVMGIWSCRGKFTNHHDPTPEDPGAYANQTFEMFEGQNVVGDLFAETWEMPEGRVEPWFRAVTGGTRRYAGVRGQAAQRNLGTNAGGGANFGYAFAFERTALSVGSPTGLDAGLRFGAARPNPFASAMAIDLETERAGQHVIDVVTIAGARVSRVYEGALPVGSHRFQWDGLDAAGRRVASGVYLYVARGPRGVTAKKITAVR